jgi:hypothetical protein
VRLPHHATDLHAPGLEVDHEQQLAIDFWHTTAMPKKLRTMVESADGQLEEQSKKITNELR